MHRDPLELKPTNPPPQSVPIHSHECACSAEWFACLGTGHMRSSVIRVSVWLIVDAFACL